MRAIFIGLIVFLSIVGSLYFFSSIENKSKPSEVVKKIEKQQKDTKDDNTTTSSKQNEVKKDIDKTLITLKEERIKEKLKNVKEQNNTKKSSSILGGMPDIDVMLKDKPKTAADKAKEKGIKNTSEIENIEFYASNIKLKGIDGLTLLIDYAVKNNNDKKIKFKGKIICQAIDMNGDLINEKILYKNFFLMPNEVNEFKNGIMGNLDREPDHVNCKLVYAYKQNNINDNQEETQKANELNILDEL